MASGGLSAGTVYVDVVARTEKFGQTAAAGINAQTSTLSSKLKGAFGTLGVTLGAVFAIGFVKSAFSEFEEKQKSLRLFNATLEETGQIAEISGERFNAALEELGSQIGVDDDALRDLATRLLNAFDFTKLAGDATDNLLMVTTAIQDMATVTGRSDTSMTRLFQTLLNDPAKALPVMQRFGVVTDQQADAFKRMIENGEGAAVTTEILATVSEKYAGRAAAAATDSEKLAFQWAEFQETVGGLLSTVLTPLIKVFTALFKLLANNEGVVKALVVSLAALGALKLVTKIDAIGMSIKGLITQVKGISPVTVVATAALVLLTAGMTANAQMAAQNEAAIQEWATAIADGTKTIEQFDAALAAQELPGWAEDQMEAFRATVLHDAALIRINQRLQEGSIELDYYRMRATQLGLTEGEITANINAANDALADTGDVADKTGRKLAGFAGMAGKELKTFRDSVVASFDQMAGGLTNVSRKWDLTAAAAERATRIIAERQTQIAKDLKKLDDLDLGEGLKNQLLLLGPDMVHAFVNGNKNTRDKIRQNLKSYDQAMEDTTKAVKQVASDGGEQTGDAYIDGAVRGITNKSPILANAARTAVRNAIEAGKDEAGIQSPSKEGIRIGEQIVDGVIKGFENKSADFETAFADIISLIHTAVENGLPKTHLTLAKNLEDIFEDQQKHLAKSLANAKSTLEKLKSAFTGFVDEIKGGFADAGDLVSGLMGLEDKSPGSLSAFLTDQVMQAQQLASGLQQLAGMGLGQAGLAALASQGIGGLPLVQALLAGGQGIVDQFGSAQGTIAGFATETGDVLGETIFGDQIRHAGEVVDQLRDRVERFIERFDTKILELLDGIKADAIKHEVEDVLDALRDLRQGFTGHVNGGGGDVNGVAGAAAAVNVNVYGDVTGREVVEKVRRGLLDIQDHNGAWD